MRAIYSIALTISFIICLMICTPALAKNVSNQANDSDHSNKTTVRSVSSVSSVNSDSSGNSDSQTNVQKNSKDIVGNQQNLTDINIKKQTTVTLKDINKAKQFTFRGAASTKELIIPLPKQWDIENIQLHLLFNHPIISDGNILLTVYIDNKPTYTTTFPGSDNNNQSWDITLDQSLLTGDFINLKIVTTIGIYNCNNLSNPNYWLSVNPDSAVTYHYSVKTNKNNLTEFPYPFINNTSLTENQVTIIIPDNPSQTDINATFYLINYLSFAQISQGININVIKLADLTNDLKVNSNIIYIGTPLSLSLTNDNMNWPLTLDKSQFISPNNQPISASTGIIQQITSPWNENRSLLVLSGNSDSGVMKAVQSIRDPNFNTRVVFNNYALIDTIKPYVKPVMTWRDTSFKELGYNDQVVFGNGDNEIDYIINFPMANIPKDVSISLNLATSPIMSKTQDSYATVMVNEAPLESTIIKPNAKLMNWKINLDHKKFWPGENNVAVILNLRSPVVGCKSDDQALAWATVLNSSTLSASFISSAPYTTLPMLASSTTDLLLAYPASKINHIGSSGLEHVFNFAKNMPNLNKVSLVNTNSFNLKSIEQDVLYIGDLNDNISLSLFKRHLPFYFQNNQLVSQPNLIGKFHLSDEVPSAIIESIYIPGDQQQLFMLITATSPTGYEQAFKFLEETKSSAYSHANVVLIYQNNSHVLLQTTELPLQSTSPVVSNLLKYGLTTLILVLLIGVYAVIKYIKNRRDAKKNKF